MAISRFDRRTGDCAILAQNSIVFDGQAGLSNPKQNIKTKFDADLELDDDAFVNFAKWYASGAITKHMHLEYHQSEKETMRTTPFRWL